MVEETTHQRPGFARIAGFEKRGRFYATIEDVGLLGPAERYLPDVLQGDAGIGRKSNGSLLRIGPTLSEIIAGSQECPPIILRRCPDAVLAPAVVRLAPLAAVRLTAAPFASVIAPFLAVRKMNEAPALIVPSGKLPREFSPDSSQRLSRSALLSNQ